MPKKRPGEAAGDPKRNPKRLLNIKGFCLFTFLLIFLLPAAEPGKAFSETIRVGTWKTAQTVQPFYYERFLPHDRITVFPFTNPADQKSALLAGSLDICGTTLAHAIHSASLGQPVVVVAALCNKCSALVVKKDGAVGAVPELRGKKIGYVPGTMHEILLRETLKKNGLSPGADVQLTRVDFFDMGTALATGGIDAFLSGEPFPSLAVHKGYGRILSYPYYDESIGEINAGMLAARSAVRKNPEKIYRLVQAHAEATHYLQSHREEWLRKASMFGTPLEILKDAEKNMELAWEMDQAYIRKAKALGERMAALGMIRGQPDYDALFDLRFTARAKERMSR